MASGSVAVPQQLTIEDKLNKLADSVERVTEGLDGIRRRFASIPSSAENSKAPAPKPTIHDLLDKANGQLKAALCDVKFLYLELGIDTGKAYQEVPQTGLR